jgi:hypothetical protein
VKNAFAQVAAELNGVPAAGERFDRYEVLLETTNAAISSLADELVSLVHHGASRTEPQSEDWDKR